MLPMYSNDIGQRNLHKLGIIPSDHWKVQTFNYAWMTFTVKPMYDFKVLGCFCFAVCCWLWQTAGNTNLRTGFRWLPWGACVCMCVCAFPLYTMCVCVCVCVGLNIPVRCFKGRVLLLAFNSSFGSAFLPHCVQVQTIKTLIFSPILFFYLITTELWAFRGADPALILY